MMESQQSKMAKESHSNADIHVSNGLTVHGAFIGQLSPIKISRSHADVKYFEGFFQRQEKNCRLSQG